MLMTLHFDYCPSASEGDNQSVRLVLVLGHHIVATQRQANELWKMVCSRTYFPRITQGDQIKVKGITI